MYDRQKTQTHICIEQVRMGTICCATTMRRLLRAAADSNRGKPREPVIMRDNGQQCQHDDDPAEWSSAAGSGLHASEISATRGAETSANCSSSRASSRAAWSPASAVSPASTPGTSARSRVTSVAQRSYLTPSGCNRAQHRLASGPLPFKLSEKSINLDGASKVDDADFGSPSASAQLAAVAQHQEVERCLAAAEERWIQEYLADAEWSSEKNLSEVDPDSRRYWVRLHAVCMPVLEGKCVVYNMNGLSYWCTLCCTSLAGVRVPEVP